MAIIRSVLPQDAAAICDIYHHYVTQTMITFEEEPVTEEAMRRRILSIIPGLPWLVAEGDAVLGYAYASRWKERAAYRHTVESTVYLRSGFEGQGLGSMLYKALLEQLRSAGFHTVVGCIALPNPASVALHEKFGYSQVAQFREVGFKFNQWIDVGYWEKILD
jgi:L-amino acid N-acyltransferase YncA